MAASRYFSGRTFNFHNCRTSRGSSHDILDYCNAKNFRFQGSYGDIHSLVCFRRAFSIGQWDNQAKRYRTPAE